MCCRSEHCESRIREWTQRATKQAAAASSSNPKGRQQTDLVPSLWVSSALCAQVLACTVQLEELEWKNLFLFQERARKIFVPIIKGEI